MARICLLVLLGLSALACSDRDAASGRERAPLASGVQVASVNGEPIGSAEVAALSRASGLPSKQALERLVAARLLAQHARALRYERSAEVVRGVAQARVQRLLALTVEQGTKPTELAVQQQKLEALLAELARRTPVTYDEAAIAKVFSGQPP
jgi:hypothetical protein